MKSFTPLFIATLCVISISCIAQRSERFSANAKMGNAQLMSDYLANNNDMAVIAYHVEEQVNMPFGGSITTYEVSNINLVNTNDLGQNNVRVVTPKYGKIKTRAAISSIPLVNPVAMVPRVLAPVKITVFIPKQSPRTVLIDILSTYERVLDKGYKSVDMLRRVSNARFFDGDLVIAAKWYTQLFEMTTDLEAVYYYRYAQSLKAVNQNEKAKEMMTIFESKDSKK